MADFVPFQLAAAKPARPQSPRQVYARDPYNFGNVSVSHGTNVPVMIPATGPHAAGAPPATSARTIAETISTGSAVPADYGANFGGGTRGTPKGCW